MRTLQLVKLASCFSPTLSPAWARPLRPCSSDPLRFPAVDTPVFPALDSSPPRGDIPDPRARFWVSTVYSSLPLSVPSSPALPAPTPLPADCACAGRAGAGPMAVASMPALMPLTWCGWAAAVVPPTSAGHWSTDPAPVSAGPTAASWVRRKLCLRPCAPPARWRGEDLPNVLDGFGPTWDIGGGPAYQRGSPRGFSTPPAAIVLFETRTDVSYRAASFGHKSIVPMSLSLSSTATS